MKDQILSVFEKYLNSEGAVVSDATLEELGLTSFSFIELVLRIEEKTGLEFDDRYLNYLMFKSVEEVVSYCEELEKDSKST